MGLESIFNVLVDLLTPFLGIPILGDIFGNILSFLDGLIPDEEAAV